MECWKVIEPNSLLSGCHLNKLICHSQNNYLKNTKSTNNDEEQCEFSNKTTAEFFPCYHIVHAFLNTTNSCHYFFKVFCPTQHIKYISRRVIRVSLLNNSQLELFKWWTNQRGKKETKMSVTLLFSIFTSRLIIVYNYHLIIISIG